METGQGVVQALVVTSEGAEAARPGEVALNDPSFRLDAAAAHARLPSRAQIVA
jgi:hypothetical protein